jgi:hypothetical protein
MLGSVHDGDDALLRAWRGLRGEERAHYHVSVLTLRGRRIDAITDVPDVTAEWFALPTRA